MRSKGIQYPRLISRRIEMGERNSPMSGALIVKPFVF